MATATRKCKVCGAEYEYCHTVRRVAGVFRWQDVACSPEHGSIYLDRIMASRSAKPTSDSVEAEKAMSAEETANNYDDLDEDEENELFEEDFDDSAEEPAIET